jgi:hypothetical protein
VIAPEAIRANKNRGLQFQNHHMFMGKITAKTEATLVLLRNSEDFLQHSQQAQPLMHIHPQDDASSRIASGAAGEEAEATSKQGKFFD